MKLKMLHLSRFLIIAGVLSFGQLYGQSLYPGQFSAKRMVRESASFKAYAFDLRDVRLLPSRFTENRDMASAWLMSLSVERLLHSFKTNAGLYAGKEGGYDSVDKLAGWEALDCELRGHSTGHILSALAMFYAATGNEQYRNKADSLVKGLAAVQTALGKSGYLSAFPEHLIDRCIAGKPVWAPWYVLHKIMAGLIDQYLYCDNQIAFEVATKMSRWAYYKLHNLSADRRAVMLGNEFGGMNDAFYALYELTADPKDQWLGDFFYHDKVLDPLKTGVDNLAGMHANTYIPKLIGIVRDYDQSGTSDYKEMAEFFWKTVVYRHSFATGSNSDHEKFFDADDNVGHLTGYTGESCNVYNMLKLTSQLFCLDANASQADYYEKALYNHILGQQDTLSGMVSYFLPMLPGAYKVYSTTDSSFWCCVGTGFENQAKYGEGIYYHKADSLYVNLFMSSVLDWKKQGVQLTQRTRFPQNGRSKIVLSMAQPKKLTIRIRYPGWAGEGASLKINGKRVRIMGRPGSYITLTRKWSGGDKIEVDFPMELKATAEPGNPKIISVTYGPIVLAGALGTENIVPPAPFSNPHLHNDYYTYDYQVPASVSNKLVTHGKDIKDWLDRVEGKPLTFKTAEDVTGKSILFYPLFNMDRQRYNVYWHLEN
ncbi:glycoside hydrolase family 127 protein [Arachidicoccus terrestris]|uniref:glycoside hydrolase family 127 protein n=1 Tax=Arachidicoccus terrestris TaxID=2875539 RepID=UPI001CC6B1AD|nr:glycoside hydrolase family 127 protein [Arachidicoccus terrestris]UAY56033.1 glycoside hydrolase family 127 protein [Arachidicoccus terrestris]